MAFVVPAVARFTVNQVLGTNQIANVLDYTIDTTGSTMSRGDAIISQAEDIAEQWEQYILPQQVNNLSLESVSYLDLNSSSGVAGTFTGSGSITLPATGTATEPPLPTNVSVLVRKTIEGTRGRRNGRLYWAGGNEAFTDDATPNQVASGALAILNPAWQSFLTSTNNVDTFGTAFSSEMVVVHVTARDTDGNPTAGDSSPVTSLSIDSLLATQRRRLRR